MKLRFTIHYQTEWGQSLQVCLCLCCTDGYQVVRHYKMMTQDGQSWLLDTSVVGIRHHHIESFQYVYQVIDKDEKVIREEWNIVPRKYIYHILTNYIFHDSWRDTPTNYDVYSKLYRLIFEGSMNLESATTHYPLFRKTIIFKVTAPQLSHDEDLAISGDHPILGNWNVDRFVKMTYLGQHEWILTLNADMLFAPLNYKFIVVDRATNHIRRWEEGDNRTSGSINLSDGEALVLTGSLRIDSQEFRTTGIIVDDLSDQIIDWCKDVGFKLIKLQYKTTSSQRLRISQFKRLKSLSHYAHSKHIALMGIIKVDMQQDYDDKRINRRLAFLENIFDAVSLDFLFSQSVTTYQDYHSYLIMSRMESMVKQTSMLLTIENNHIDESTCAHCQSIQCYTLRVLANPDTMSYELAHVETYPRHCIACISTPKTISLKQWWESDYSRAQYYYITVLHKQGEAPRKLTPVVVEDLIARYLFCPASICLLTWQDLCQLDINSHDKPLSLNQLMDSEDIKNKLKLMINQSKRNENN